MVYRPGLTTFSSFFYPFASCADRLTRESTLFLVFGLNPTLRHSPALNSAGYALAAATPAAAAMTVDQDALQYPIRSNPDLESFDIVSYYHKLLADDPGLTMPVAAIESLIEALSQSSATTVFETMDLVKTQSAKLRAAVRNPIALTHGTELFQQYLVISLKQPGPDGKETSSHENFEVVRQHLMRNTRLFVQRAKEARLDIANVGRQYVRDGYTILTHGGSRVVGTLLGRAAEPTAGDARRRFRVIHVVNDARRTESSREVAALRAKGVPVATIPESAVAYSMGQVNMVLVGAEAVTANGGIISRMGTYQIALLAKARKKDFFVAAEQHKFGKTFPVDQSDFGFDQGVIDFRAADERESDKGRPQPIADPVDYTPPEFITSLFTNTGVFTPTAVAKQIIDLLY
ncbi:nagb/rpia/CoA transferase-like protein [Durotheca rogersii]|uniref:nagb/rpia/CoA transferase-like protein n=1 Tax=Durotheca rogersii TaxID=419775 RepID=UPI002220369F|nr:nagb/rpia/CoA transferase-like protein [Durotheca rogersii]KAI5868642.1 nagb/rpia/CoA transferase-like protein [Durotheca rogersii]